MLLEFKRSQVTYGEFGAKLAPKIELTLTRSLAQHGTRSGCLARQVAVATESPHPDEGLANQKHFWFPLYGAQLA